MQGRSIGGALMSEVELDTGSHNWSFAVNHDETLLAVTTASMIHSREPHHVVLQKLPTGEQVASYGTKGSDPGEFCCPRGICFTSDGSMLIADSGNKRIQNITTTGNLVRIIGHGVFTGDVMGVTANDDVIVASQVNTRANRLLMFDSRTGAFMRWFGACGHGRGQLWDPRGLRMMPDGGHIIVTDQTRLSVFALSGEFVCHIGSTFGLNGASDVCFDDGNNMIVAGNWTHEVLILSGDGSRVLRRIGGQSPQDSDVFEPFKYPIGVTMVNGQLYVLQNGTTKVYVFS